VFANSERQEVTLAVKRKANGTEGGEDVYVLKLTTSAAIALEGKLKKSTGEILMDMGRFSVSTLRDVLHVMLQEHHAKDFPPTPNGATKVADLMDRIGKKALATAIADAIGFKEEEAEGGPNPPEAQAGTGDGSTSTPGASA
jgi:hypothetical protein